MGGLISFLGGAAFRAVWGEIASYFSKKQEHKFEQQRMLLQGKLDGEAHARNLESLKLQAALGVKEIEVQRDADVARGEMQAFIEAQAAARAPTGIRWVDAWNAMIRPAFGTLALILVAVQVVSDGWKMIGVIMDIVLTTIGWFFASRELTRRGK